MKQILLFSLLAFASTALAQAPYGNLEPLKARFVQKVSSKVTQDQLLDSAKLQKIIAEFNQSTEVAKKSDVIDLFLSKLPENYRRHYTFVHRSFSIQKGTPLSPRVILYGPNARIIMTFNAGLDEKNQPMPGGNTIELMEWNTRDASWEFSELAFDVNNRIHKEVNPAKCVMCHTGTPKTVQIKDANVYHGYMKPIFPQYPFWPGFYGSVNDIVGVVENSSRDTIMKDLGSTVKQIKDLTFASTEELFRLRELLDKNPKYLDVVKNELDVHNKYFHKFIGGMKERSRYRHLLSLQDLYAGEKIPELLRSAPYRRTFDKDYGHYLLRPNFYLSSLLTFFQAQTIAKQIKQFPLYDKFKHSLLARKYNCDAKAPLKVGNLALKDLDPTFDLVYPNVGSPESRDRQYLLAYQYNILRASRGGPAQLPLHAWNLEANEDIASYHYGNVFSDLNELVLWQLATSAFPDIKLAMGRGAAEERHYILPNSTYLKSFLEGNGGLVSKFTSDQMTFAQNQQNYYGAQKKFAALPVSKYCGTHFLPAASKELNDLASRPLPHHTYTLDPRLSELTDIRNPDLPTKVLGARPPQANAVRQACESCHSEGANESQQIHPRFNVNWFSDTYHHDLHNSYVRYNGDSETKLPLKDLIEEALSPNTLPIPFGSRMPFGRRPMDDFSLKCELMLVRNNFNSSVPLKMKGFKCPADNPNSDECLCRKLYNHKERLYRELFPER